MITGWDQFSYSSFIFDKSGRKIDEICYSNQTKHLPGRSLSINNQGDAAGVVAYAATTDGVGVLGAKGFAFFWDHSRQALLSLDNLCGNQMYYSFATKVNDLKQVVGVSETVDQRIGSERQIWHACLWEKGQVSDLGVLEPGEDSIAYSINNEGVVIGMSGDLFKTTGAPEASGQPFNWSSDIGMQNLNNLIDPSMGWQILDIKDINNQGEVVGFARKENKTFIELIQPIGSPKH